MRLYGSAAAAVASLTKEQLPRTTQRPSITIGLRYKMNYYICHDGPVDTVLDRGTRVRGSIPILASLFYDAKRKLYRKGMFVSTKTKCV